MIEDCMEFACKVFDRITHSTSFAHICHEGHKVRMEMTVQWRLAADALFIGQFQIGRQDNQLEVEDNNGVVTMVEIQSMLYILKIQWKVTKILLSDHPFGESNACWTRKVDGLLFNFTEVHRFVDILN